MDLALNNPRKLICHLITNKPRKCDFFDGTRYVPEGVTLETPKVDSAKTDP